MIRVFLFSALYLISQPVLAEQLDVPPYAVGEWGGWQVGCMVDPFIGPLCGVEKTKTLDSEGPQRLSQNSLGKLKFEKVPEKIRVWISKNPSDEFVSFGKSGYSGTDEWEVRIDGNNIWTITKVPGATDLAVTGETAEKIRDEMLQGQILYLRTDVPTVESMKKGTSYTKFSLSGFSDAYGAMQNEYKKLFNEFNKKQKP